MPLLLSIAILLVMVLGAGAAVRTWRRRPDDDRSDWERTLVEWRDLRDEGVLTEEEYRRVRTLVEPLTRIGTPDPRAGQQPIAGVSGPDHERM